MMKRKLALVARALLAEWPAGQQEWSLHLGSEICRFPGLVQIQGSEPAVWPTSHFRFYRKFPKVLQRASSLTLPTSLNVDIVHNQTSVEQKVIFSTALMAEL